VLSLHMSENSYLQRFDNATTTGRFCVSGLLRGRDIATTKGDLTLIFR